MKNSVTIWESASRPLFVRSVWLEIARNECKCRGQRQRHFILDYQPTGRQQKRKGLLTTTPLSPIKRCGKNAELGQLLPYDFVCPLGNLDVSTDDLLRIGSAKMQLHQLPTACQQQTKAPSSRQKNARRASVLSKSSNGKQFDSGQNRRLPEFYELISRRSSFQDLQSVLSNSCTQPDERLAERVLNWLDLAGKLDVMKTSDELKEQTIGLQTRDLLSRRTLPMPSVTTNAQMQPQRRHEHIQRRKRSTQSKLIASAAKLTCHQRRPDSMKHITIIFNKDGFPVRLNRPARNIDLCTLASSAGTTKRLAGALASARLYKSTIDCNGGSGNAVMPSTSRPQITRNAITEITRHTYEKHIDDSEKTFGLQLQKRQQDENVSTTASNYLHDAKKQLHIFMPSLPKKGLLTASLMGNSSAGGGDDIGSTLSGSFNEFCKL